MKNKEVKEFKKDKIRKKYQAKRFGAFLLNDNKPIQLSFLIVSSLLLISYSISFFFMHNTTQVTISYIGNHGFRLGFIIWGILTATLVGLMLVRLYNTYSYDSKISKNFLRAAYVSLIACVIIPSHSSISQIYCDMHLLTAVLFPVFCTLSMAFFIRHMINKNKKIGVQILVLFLLTYSLPLIAYLMFGHCAVYEILYFVALVIYIVIIYFVLEKNKHKLN